MDMKLKAIREENDLTQSELANDLNISRSVYGMWEIEQDFIPVKRLNDFCNYFGVSIDYVLGFTNIKNYKNFNKNIDFDKIKERVKILRKNKNLTQGKLSSKINIAQSLISKYENGTNMILTCNLIEYCRFFEVSADYLLGRIDEPLKISKSF